MGLAGLVRGLLQTCGCSNDGTAAGDWLGFVLKVEKYKESRTPALKMFSFVNCYQLIENNREQGA